MSSNEHQKRIERLVSALAIFPRGERVDYVDLARKLNIQRDEAEAALTELLAEGAVQRLFPPYTSLTARGRSLAVLFRDNRATSDEDRDVLDTVQASVTAAQAQMASRKEWEANMAKTHREHIGEPRMQPSTALRLLHAQIATGNAILQSGAAEGPYSAWKIATENILSKAFGINSETVNDITQKYHMKLIPLEGTEEQHYKYRHDDLQGIIERLDGAISILNTEVEEASIDATPTKVIAPNRAEHRIFVVHGHDGHAEQHVVTFLKALKLKPVVLHDQANRGKTIIEKLETESEGCRFAIVLLTPDDEGGKIGQEVSEKRARQNVIFELGYFVGKLRRENVCCLYKGVKLPTDFDGVVYVPMDEHEGWHKRVVKELLASGFKVSLDDLL